MSQYQKEIRDTLRNILTFVGADLKYVGYAQLESYMEWLLKNCGVKGGRSDEKTKDVPY